MPQYTKSGISEFAPERQPVGWPWRLLLISFTVLGLVIAVYAGLVYGYGNFLDSKINSQNAELENLGQSINENDRESFLNFYSQLTNLKIILNQHARASKVFGLLEQNTNAQVYYTSLALDIKNNQLSLGGVAPSFENLSEQGAAFLKIGDVSQVIFDDSEFSNKNLIFKIRLILKPAFLRSGAST